jgi:hypothetical protein
MMCTVHQKFSYPPECSIWETTCTTWYLILTKGLVENPDYGKLQVLPNANDGPGRHAASRGDIQPLYLLVGTRNTLVPAHCTTQC